MFLINTSRYPGLGFRSWLSAHVVAANMLCHCLDIPTWEFMLMLACTAILTGRYSESSPKWDQNHWDTGAFMADCQSKFVLWPLTFPLDGYQYQTLFGILCYIYSERCLSSGKFCILHHYFVNWFEGSANLTYASLYILLKSHVQIKSTLCTTNFIWLWSFPVSFFQSLYELIPFPTSLVSSLSDASSFSLYQST